MVNMAPSVASFSVCVFLGLSFLLSTVTPVGFPALNQAGHSSPELIYTLLVMTFFCLLRKEM